MSHHNRGGGRRGKAATLPDEPPFTCFIGNLPKATICSDIEDIFSECEVAEVRLIYDKIDNTFKGFGYVEFKTREGIIKALDFNGALLEGRSLKVDVAEQKRDNRRGGDRNQSGGGRGRHGGDRDNYQRGPPARSNDNYQRGPPAHQQDNFQRGPPAHHDNFQRGPPAHQNNGRNHSSGHPQTENYENFSNRNTRNFSQGSQGGGGGGNGGGYGQQGPPQGRRRIDSRSSQHSFDGDRRGGGGGGGGGGYNNRNDSAFAEPAAPSRPRLNLKARSKPAEAAKPAEPSRNSSIFGTGRARDALVPAAAAPNAGRSPRNSTSSNTQTNVANVTQDMAKLATN